jgi:drug/metabolite transporter (DMT)-like permease
MLGFLVWSEIPGWHVLAGSAIVIASGLYIIYRETRKHAPVIAHPLSDAS